jgi:hypothetical protein
MIILGPLKNLLFVSCLQAASVLFRRLPEQELLLVVPREDREFLNITRVEVPNEKIFEGTESPLKIDPRELPLLIGAGMGATGTHTLFRALCILGIPSVHFRETCVRPLPDTRSKYQSHSDEAIMLSPQLIQGLKAHLQAIQAFRGMKKCAVQARGNTERTTECGTHELMQLQEKLLQQASLVFSSGIGAVHDVPYPQLWQWWIRNSSSAISASSSYAQRDHRLLLTQRNPTEWAQRRSEKHGYTADIACWMRGNPNNTNLTAAFDLPACLDKEKDPSRVLWGYHLIPPSQDSSRQQQEFLSFLSKSLNQYQILTRKRPDMLFSVNLWDESWNSSSLAVALQHVLERDFEKGILQKESVIDRTGPNKLIGGWSKLKKIPSLMVEPLVPTIWQHLSS